MRAVAFRLALRLVPSLAVLFCVLTLAPATAQDQSPLEGLLQINDEVHEFLLRQHTRGLLPDKHLTNQPLSAYQAQAYLDLLADDPDARAAMTAIDRRLLDEYRGVAPGAGVGFVRNYASALYRDGRTFIGASGEDYVFQAEPLAYLSLGSARQTGAATAFGDQVTTLRNTRGFRIAGHVDLSETTKIFVESRVMDNQYTLPQGAVVDLSPDYRPFGERIGERDFDNGDTYDYWLVSGIVGFDSKHFEARFGRDQNRWGPGYGSLLLSNYAPTYDFLQFRTRFWRIEYVNLFAAFVDVTRERDAFSRQVRAKYGSLHRLSIDLPYGLQFAVSEAATLAPTDEDRGPEFYLAYLNPVIFYRALDFEMGSPANMLLAFDGQWTIPSAWLGNRGATLYYQFVFDEFRASEFFSGNGWRNNKWGVTLGARLVDLPVSNLDLTLEYARIRPFTYTSANPARAYVHRTGLIGHPIGPNAQDVSFLATYRPMTRLLLGLGGAFTSTGRNAGGFPSADGFFNFGSDPLVSYNECFQREDTCFGNGNEFGNEVGQGIGQTRVLLEGRVGYELLPKLTFEVAGRLTSQTDEQDANRDFGFVDLYATLRWGLPFQSFRF
ncbi:MAG: capsule assembly Wzi family protein [Bacteroidota bacterium]